MKNKKRNSKAASEEALLARLESKREETRGWLFHKLLIVLPLTAVIVLALVIAGNAAYDVYLDYQDKKRFEIVRESLRKLHERLQYAAAPDIGWKMNTFCSQGSVKFQESLKSCESVTQTAILLQSDDQASRLIETYQTLFKDSTQFTFKGRDSPPKPISFPSNLSKGYDGASFREKETGMLCSSFFEIDDELQGEVTTKKRNLEISFRCRDRARELHYPERTYDQIIQESSD